MKTRLMPGLLLLVATASAWAGPCLNTNNQDLFCVTSLAAGYNVPGGGGQTTINLMMNFFVVSNGGPVKLNYLQIRFYDSENPGLTYISQDSVNVPGTFWKSQTRYYVPGVEGPPYQIQIQGCVSLDNVQNQFQPDGCYGWSTIGYTPPPPNTAPTCGNGFVAVPCPTPPGGGVNPGVHLGQSGPPPGGPVLVQPGQLGTKFNSGSQQSNSGMCKQGFVWRQADQADKVCVTPQTRGQVAIDNKAAAQRQGPNGQCLKGFVWREANPQDHVCVTPQTRTQTAQENSLASTHVAAP